MNILKRDSLCISCALFGCPKGKLIYAKKAIVRRLNIRWGTINSHSTLFFLLLL